MSLGGKIRGHDRVVAQLSERRGIETCEPISAKRHQQQPLVSWHCQPAANVGALPRRVTRDEGNVACDLLEAGEAAGHRKPERERGAAIRGPNRVNQRPVRCVVVSSVDPVPREIADCNCRHLRSRRRRECERGNIADDELRAALFQERGLTCGPVTERGVKGRRLADAFSLIQVEAVDLNHAGVALDAEEIHCAELV